MSGYNIPKQNNFKYQPVSESSFVPDDYAVGTWSFMDLAIENENIHLGFDAGLFNQQTGSIAIGHNAGQSNQGYTGDSTDDEDNGDAIAIGTNAGYLNQFAKSIAIGFQAGQSDQGVENGSDADVWSAVAIGNQAGQIRQIQQSIAIGYQAGQSNQGINYGGYSGADGYSIAIGSQAGQDSQHQQTVAIGYRAGQYGQRWGSVAIGLNAGQSNQEPEGIAIGNGAGRESQAYTSLAIGYYAGAYQQGTGAGGEGNNNNHAIAIGCYAAESNQISECIAIGHYAGQTNQGGAGGNSIAIGTNAGNSGQGSSSIAIGSYAGETNQHDNTIVISAQGTVNTQQANSTYIAPVRQNTSAYVQGLFYDPNSYEVVQGPAGSVIRMRMIPASQLGVTSPVTSGSMQTFASYTYTPASTDSTIVIDFITEYDMPGSSGDRWNSQILVVQDATNDTIALGQQRADGSYPARSSMLFPLMGAHRNTTGSNVLIYMQAQLSAADDAINVYANAGMWLKITEYSGGLY